MQIALSKKLQSKTVGKMELLGTGIHLAN